MSDTATSLNTLSDETLVQLGRKLDIAGEDQDWYALVQKLPDRLYAGPEGRKRIQDISLKRFQTGAPVVRRSGYSLLNDLKTKNVTVNELITALEELGQEDCLRLLLPKGKKEAGTV